MRVIGISGGVGSGKSSVLNYIEENYDARVVQADEVGYLLMLPGGDCYQEVIELFGEWIVMEDGTLDRMKIAEIVFQKREMLDRLDGIIHPAVKEYIKREVARARKEDVPYFFIEAALLIEEKYDEIYDELWVVYCEPQVRRERSGMTGGIQIRESTRFWPISSAMMNMKLPQTLYFTTARMWSIPIYKSTEG